MTDTSTELKWFCRSILACLIGLMSYVIFQPSYNFAHWMPHSLLRELGVPYSMRLGFEIYADKLLHPLGAAMLTVLFSFAKLPLIQSKLRIMVVMMTAMFAAELIQLAIGRKFDLIDLILGVLGSCLALYFLPKK